MAATVAQFSIGFRSAAEKNLSRPALMANRLLLAVVVWAYFMRQLVPVEYERVYLPLYKVADTPFHIQGDELCSMSGGNGSHHTLNSAVYANVAFF